MGMVSLRGNRTEVSKFSVSLVPLVLWFLDDQHKAYKKALLLFFFKISPSNSSPFPGTHFCRSDCPGLELT